MVVLLGLLAKLFGDLDLVDLDPEVVSPDHSLHVDHVDDAAEVLLLPDRELHRHGVGSEPVNHRLHGAEKVGSDAIHIVDESDARDPVPVGLAPDGL